MGKKPKEANKMKKMFCILLALMLLLAGCAEVEQPGETTAAPRETTQPEETTFPTLAPDAPVIGPILGDTEGEEAAFANPGKVRIEYQGNRSYVRYVTSVGELPPEGSWEGYDADYFQTRALLIVVETVASGSVQLELESIRISGGNASVSIKRSMSGDVGTSDMATWMLWAEVDKGLDFTWTLANASQLPAGEKY